MSGAFGRRGDTRAWRRLRVGYGARLPVPCWRCGEMIWPGDAFDLGHVHDRALGGGDDDLAPEHRACNRSAGGRLGRAMQADAAGRHVRPGPSRVW